jgi:hypothetical protein
MGSKGGLQFMVTDSWEAGTQNWTQNKTEFEKRRGYSLLLDAGIDGSYHQKRRSEEQFLWDYRKTLVSWLPNITMML